MSLFTADTFRSVFEYGHTPDTRLPGMPLTAAGTLLNLICQRPKTDAVIKYPHADGSSWWFEVQSPPHGLVLGADITITRPSVRGKGGYGEVRVKVYAPTVDTDNRGAFSLTDSLIQASALVAPREARALPTLLEVAAVLAEVLNDEAPTALAPQLEAQRAEWEGRTPA